MYKKILKTFKQKKKKIKLSSSISTPKKKRIISPEISRINNLPQLRQFSEGKKNE